MIVGLKGYSTDLPPDALLVSRRSVTTDYLVVSEQGNYLIRPCHRCKSLQKTGDFYPGKSHCKACHKQMVYDWQAKNPRKVAKYKSKYNKAWRLRQKCLV